MKKNSVFFQFYTPKLTQRNPLVSLTRQSATLFAKVTESSSFNLRRETAETKILSNNYHLNKSKTHAGVSLDVLTGAINVMADTSAGSYIFPVQDRTTYNQVTNIKTQMVSYFKKWYPPPRSFSLMRI